MWDEICDIFDVYEEIKTDSARSEKKGIRFTLPITGNTRVIRRFAWFPIKVRNVIYWLEPLKIHQTYHGAYERWHNDWVIED